MTIQHASIQDPAIHEPKGVAGATQNTVYVADGAGSGVWTPIDYPVVAENVLSARSFIDQNPAGTDTSLQITFGSEQTSPEADVSSAGAFTIKEAGTYEIVFVFRLSRTTATGSALLGLRWLVNGSTQGGPTAIRLPDSGYTIPFSFTSLIYLNSGDIVTAELIRDSSGVDNGGISSASFVSAAWPDSASAVAILNKLTAGL